MPSALGTLVSSSGPCWLSPFGTVDWNPCFRAEVLNAALPYAAIVLSAIFWAAAVAVDKRHRQEKFAREVAQLNPDSSNFYQTFPESSETSPIVQATTPAERVFQTENAVVIDAALSIKEDLSSCATHERIAQEHRAKRILECVVAAMLALTHIAGASLSAEWERSWIVFWLYGTALSLYTLRTCLLYTSDAADE